MAFNSAFANYYQPLGVEVRWLNYTIRPATTIGESATIAVLALGSRQIASSSAPLRAAASHGTLTLCAVVLRRPGGVVPAILHARCG